MSTKEDSTQRSEKSTTSISFSCEGCHIENTKSRLSVFGLSLSHGWLVGTSSKLWAEYLCWEVRQPSPQSSSSLSLYISDLPSRKLSKTLDQDPTAWWWTLYWWEFCKHLWPELCSWCWEYLLNISNIFLISQIYRKHYNQSIPLPDCTTLYQLASRYDQRSGLSWVLFPPLHIWRRAW